jgi:hypothetical protein
MKHIKLFEDFSTREDQHSLLKSNKEVIAKLVKNSGIDDAVFGKQDLITVADFIATGAPSESYLKRIVDILEENGIDTSEIN